MSHAFRTRIAARLARGFGSRASQNGAVAPFLVLALIGGLMAAGFAVDTLRMTSDAGQLKRATDAAALALGRELIRDSKGFDTVGPGLAGDYVRANLGAGSDLKATLREVGLTRNAADGGVTLLEVTARFTSQPMMSGNAPKDLTIRSAVEVHVGTIEVALVLPLTLDMTSDEIAAVSRISQNFATDLMRDDGQVYLSVVPYYQRVNVYDPKHVARIRSWARPETLRPKELAIGDFFGQTGIADLAAPDTPDLQTGRACLLRGLSLGENYFWDQAPGSSFAIGYRYDIGMTTPPGDFPAVWWTGPAPSEFSPDRCPPDPDIDEGAVSDRPLIADKGCPSVPVLPLTRDAQSIADRLRSLRTKHVHYPGAAANTNFGFALAWAAMTLAPAFRGAGGWDEDPALPRDFDTGTNERQKVIVMLITAPRFMRTISDADSSIAYTNCEPTTGNKVPDLPARYRGLCSSFRRKNIRTFLLINETDGQQGQPYRNAIDFRSTVGENLATCGEKSTDISYFPGANFAAVQQALQDRLTEIVEVLRSQGSTIRLIR